METEADALSYLRGADVPLLDLTLSQALSQTARKFPQQEALVVSHEGVRLTWSELERQVTAVARGLAGLGLRPGDRAGIWASNCLEWVLLQYAAPRAGIVLVNVNPAYRSHELRYVLAKSHIRALFLREKDSRADYRAILAESRNGDRLPLEHIVWLGGASWDAMLAGGADFPENAAAPDDVVNIQYTSGTTGAPKGAMLSHRNLLNNGLAMATGLKATEHDRICAPVPLYHCFGSVIGSMVSVVSGAALILPSAQFDALATLTAVHEERATAVYGVPTMFIAELEHPEFARFDLTSLRTGVMAGAPCPIEVMRRVVEHMHCPEITIVYGQTESSPGITMSHADDPLELRVTTVGTALPNTEIQIVDPQTGRRLPVGEQGELCTRGYLVMKGYDDDPESTAKAIDNEGWLHTGDLAVMRPDGYFSFKGRREGHHHSRRREHLSARSGGLSAHPSQGRRRVRGGIAGRQAGRDRAGVDQAEERRAGDRRRDPRFLPRQDRLLQGPAVHPFRGFVSHDGEQEGAEVPDSRPGDRGTPPGRRGAAGHGITPRPPTKFLYRYIQSPQRRRTVPAGAAWDLAVNSNT